MLKWWTGGRGPRAAPLITDDPLASLAERTPRKHEPVYSVIRVNPLFREGPTPTPSTDASEDAASCSGELSLPGSERETEREGSVRERAVTRHLPPPGTAAGEDAADSGHCSPEGSRAAGELIITRPLIATENRTHLSPPSKVEISSCPSLDRVTAPKRLATLGKRPPLRGGHEWVGFDVLVMNVDFVASLAVNLAKTESIGGAEVDLFNEKRPVRVGNVIMPRTLTPRMLKNPQFVRHVQVPTAAEHPTTCHRLSLNKNAEFVVSISAPCVHTKTKNLPVSFRPVVRRTEACPKVTVDVNANYIVNISTLCPHVVRSSGGTEQNELARPDFCIGSSTHQYITGTGSQCAGSAPLSYTAPDSLVTASLLAMTSSDPDLSRDGWPSCGSGVLEEEEGRTPERVLRQLSHVIASSRSVSAVRRVSSDLRSSSASSRSSVTSQVSRASSCRQLTAPGAAELWQRTGLLTNGRKLLLGGEQVRHEEQEEPTEASSTCGLVRLTPSPPVPARLPVSGGWLQRLTETAVRSADSDPCPLTDVVVEPPRRVTFSLAPHAAHAGVTSLRQDAGPGLAGESSLTSPWLMSTAGEQQGLWNGYYGGAVAGYGPLQPHPQALVNNHKASALHVSDVVSTRLRRRG